MPEKVKLDDIPPELRTALAEMLVDGSGEVLDVMSVLNATVAGNLNFNPGHPLTSFETNLEHEQALWVNRMIEQRYLRTRFINSPLLNTQGAPPFPHMEAIKRSALKQLTPQQVEYMMEPGRPSFSFQMKLITPPDRLYLLMKLINDQKRRIKGQKDLGFMRNPEHYLCKNRPATKMEWKWEFVQAEPVMNQLAKDDVFKMSDLRTRLAFFTIYRPKGMRGVDRFTWATLMADSLDRGRPLDLIGEGMHATALDEENIVLQDVNSLNQCIMVGRFSIHNIRPEIEYRLKDCDPKYLVFRSSVSGPIDYEEPVMQ